jgi:archaemetzincin
MKYLYVAAPPEVRPEDHRLVSGRLSGVFDLPVREMQIPAVDFAYDAGRRQYSSIAVLEMTLPLIPDDAAKLLAVTDRDLFVPVLTFLFGQAQLGGRAGVLSFARLRQEFYGFAPNRALFAERAAKEALHETGHMFGLVHCSERSCAMSLATSIRQIDMKQAAFCAPCRARLAKTKGVVG